MSVGTIPRATVWEDSGVVLMARVLGYDGDPIQQADITSISRKVFDGGTTISTDDLVVADVIFDALQTGDSRWDADDTGFNVLDIVPAASLPNGDTVYRVEYLFTPASGEVFHDVFDLITKNLRAS